MTSSIDTAVPEQDIDAVLDCLRSGWLTMGPRTQQFERALSECIGAPHVSAVSSGTAALHLALLAAAVGPGDEVVVPALAFVATANAVRYTGARPVFCDIGSPHDLNIDTEDAARRVTARTKAVIAVHLCGYPAQLAALRALCDRHSLVLIEDCALALGAIADKSGRKVGTVGDLAAFSFSTGSGVYVGEGGAVATADERLDKRVRLLRSHALTSGTWDRHRGHEATYDVVDIGFNYRMDEPRAALGLSRLPRLEREIAVRRDIARALREAVADLPDASVPWDDAAVESSSGAAVVLVLPDRAVRDRVRDILIANGINTTHYPSIPSLAEYREYAAAGGPVKSADVAERHLVRALAISSDSLRPQPWPTR